MKKTILITGSTAGIGLETAKQLLGLGARVIITARDLERGAIQLEALQKISNDVDMIQLDVTSEESAARAFFEIEKKYGYIDVLINNAGLSVREDFGPMMDASVDGWKTTFETNLFGAFRITKHFLPLLKKSVQGSIVNISSGLGSLGNRTNENDLHYRHTLTAYSSSKAALNMFTIQLAKELKPLGIRVNAVCPGSTRTNANPDPSAHSVELGAEVPVKVAMMGADGPTGEFFHHHGTYEW